MKILIKYKDGFSKEIRNGAVAYVKKLTTGKYAVAKITSWHNPEYAEGLKDVAVIQYSEE